MLGQLKFYDEGTAWGLIIGEDWRLYAVRRTHMTAPPPEPGDRVTFEPRRTPGGLRAVAVRKADGKSPRAVTSEPPPPVIPRRWAPPPRPTRSPPPP